MWQVCIYYVDTATPIEMVLPEKQEKIKYILQLVKHCQQRGYSKEVKKLSWRKLHE